MRYTYD